MSETSPTLQRKSDSSAAEDTRGGQFYTPQVDICETDSELVLFADLPGVRSDGVDLHYEKGELVLHGRVSPRGPGRPYLLNEYGTGDFYRVFSIHESIDSSRISAECKNGVLTVHLPKMEALQPRKIAVQSA
jgi:HSP20 family molecular chaperone IbpA